MALTKVRLIGGKIVAESVVGKTLDQIKEEQRLADHGEVTRKNTSRAFGIAAKEKKVTASLSTDPDEDPTPWIRTELKGSWNGKGRKENQ